MVIFQPVILVFRGALSHKTSPLCRLPPLILITLLRLDSFTNINVCGGKPSFHFSNVFCETMVLFEWRKFCCDFFVVKLQIHQTI